VKQSSSLDLFLMVLGASSAVATQGCVKYCEFGGANDRHRHVVAILQGRWQLVELNGSDTRGIPSAAGRVPCLSFREDGSIAGFTGAARVWCRVNTWKLSDRQVDFERAPECSQASGSTSALDLHRDFLAVLSSADSSAIEADAWIISGYAGEMRLECVSGSSARRQAIDEANAIRKRFEHRNEIKVKSSATITSILPL